MSAPLTLTLTHPESPARAWSLAAPVSLAAELSLDATGPRWFGAPPAHSWPNRVGDFSGSVLTGASCNCRNWQLTPHGSGTHTEGVGHLTTDDHHAIAVLPLNLTPALLVRITPVDAAGCDESADHPPQPGDRLITAAALRAAWPSTLPLTPAALILATSDSGAARDPDPQSLPAYLTRECAELLVARGIWHLVVELPSIDRLDDGGQLTAHRIFFGLPPRRTQVRLPLAADARRPQATVTELARIPGSLRPGAGFLQIHAPAIQGDAVPSRPLWFALASATGS